jgi:hypothetical protein
MTRNVFDQQVRSRTLLSAADETTTHFQLIRKFFGRPRQQVRFHVPPAVPLLYYAAPLQSQQRGSNCSLVYGPLSRGQQPMYFGAALTWMDTDGRENESGIRVGTDYKATGSWPGFSLTLADLSAEFGERLCAQTRERLIDRSCRVI